MLETTKTFKVQSRLLGSGKSLEIIMRILSAVLFLAFAFASEALAECGNLCDSSWWGTATNADLQAELNAGADVMAKGGYNGETPLHYAAEYGTAEVIETLIASGADVMALDDYAKTQLHKAAWAGTPETIRALVAAGADVMALDDNGSTPLLLLQFRHPCKHPSPACRWCRP